MSRFVICTAVDYRLPFRTWTVTTGVRRHVHRDAYGGSWAEDMALRFCIPVHVGRAEGRQRQR